MSLAAAIAEYERAMIEARVDWVARERMLYRRPDYQRLQSLAHDLRNGDPLSMDFLRFKREYQSAVTWWLAGTLRAREFFLRVRAFERAIDREFLVLESRQMENTYWTKDYRAFVRRWNKEGFVSRVGWARLNEQRRREKRWREERVRREATRSQRAFLRQGETTMRAIRRVLRGQDPLPQPESTLARSSRT